MSDWAGGKGRGVAGGRFRSPVGSSEEDVIMQATGPKQGAAPRQAAARKQGAAPRQAAAAAKQATAPKAAAPKAAAPKAAAPRQAAPRQAAARNRANARRRAAQWRAMAERSGDIAAQWAPTAGRILLGLVLAWFGYHELRLPGEWTGYIPVLNDKSSLAIVAVLAHGWMLLVLAVALVAGIAPRVSAAIAGLLMLEIVISLSVQGLSDTSMRDVGVLGLAICLIGCRSQRLVLRN